MAALRATLSESLMLEGALGIVIDSVAMYLRPAERP